MIDTKGSLTGDIENTQELNGDINKSEKIIPPKLQEKTATPTEQTQNIMPDENYNGLSKVIVNPIPSEYIIPSGTYNITDNGTYNIKEYEEVNVEVSSGSMDWATAINGFNDYLKSIVNNYTPYTDNSITIYSKSSNCPYYMIQKRSNGKYRIVWHCLPYIQLESSSYQSFGYLKFDYPSGSSKKITNIVYTLSDYGEGTNNDKIGYYSNEFNTLEDLMVAIQNSSGSGINYTSFTSNNRYTGILDSTWLTPITNATIFESDRKTIVEDGKTISHNTTILFL